MANRVTPLTTIELLSGNISAQTYFDNNISPAFTALNDASLGYNNYIGTDTGSANNYIVTCAFGSPSAYNAGMRIHFKPANSNTGASTMTVSPLTSVSILRPDGTACIGGEIVAGVNIDLDFNGTAFVIVALPWMPFTTFLGTLSTNQSVNCQSSNPITVIFNYTAAITLTLNNVPLGVPITIIFTNSGSGALLLKLAVTLPGATPYTVISTKLAGTATSFSNNWITGVSNSVGVANVLNFWSVNNSGTLTLEGINS